MTEANESTESPSHKWVYLFEEGNGENKSLFGGKGAGLCEMTRAGLPVPPGLIVTTEACNAFYANNKQFPDGMWEQVKEALIEIEKKVGKKFGDSKNPLLVSVRSGAAFSMPGMMDTVLNLGLNEETVHGLAEQTGDLRFALDAYRRFASLFGEIVIGVAHEKFERVMDRFKGQTKGGKDTDLKPKDLSGIIAAQKEIMRAEHHDIPDDPYEQLRVAIAAVFNSWMGRRAIDYRRINRIPDDLGTAVNVQAMVFGNTGVNSGSGVAFTRDPATGKKVFYGEFLINAQGEDVVAGVRTPEPVADLKKHLPKALVELERIRHVLEAHFKDVQDFEFTIQDGKVFMLQTRNGKRTGVAAVKFACDMVREKLIEWKTAITRVPADQLDQVLAPVFDRAALKSAKAIASGLPAGPGAATGRVYFNADRAAAAAHKGEKVLLVRVETSPEDLRGMIAAEGILTARGGVSSHAALVARQMGKVCICGASALNIDYRAKTMSVNGAIFREGENYLSIDGTSGTVYADQLRNAPSEIIQGLLHGDKIARRSETYRNFNQLMGWCAKVTRMSVRTNADTPEQVENAVAFGASGIGLCRTEHMFFEGDRIDAMRQMILARKADDRQKALAKLLPYQKGDFVGIFKALKGKPATIRLLDPPLHEFLPQDHAAQSALAEKIGVSQEEIARRVHELHEQNPMLGHRGCRLGISFPEVTEMQAHAIFEAAAEVQKSGTKVHPEVMIPLVGFKRELELQVEIVRRVAQDVQAAKKVKFSYLVGTMIEVPRGALTADEIAETAEFFSFGTNDLTQTALGMSRDDSGSFLPHYAELEIVKRNPFATIDQDGVGQLMQIAIEKGRKTRPKIKLGICGEHGGDPDSVKFCHRLGLDYVSCSPFRVPIARLAAAQAVLAK